MSVLDIVTITVYLLQILSIVAVIFLERKDPVTTLTWVLVLSFLPVVGVILYFFLGRGLKFYTARKMRLRREARSMLWNELPEPLREFVGPTVNVVKGDAYTFQDPAAADYLDLMRLNVAYADSFYTQDNRLWVYTDTRKAYDALFEDIRNAKHHIHAMYFIISNNGAGREFLDLLTQKAKEGVQVRLVYDELGSIATPPHIFRALRKAGGEVYRFFPLRLGSILRANYRNHHKIVVVDGRVAHTGGMNIGDEYLGLDKRKTPWRDTHMRIEGGAVTSLQVLFLLDLYYATNNGGKIFSCLNGEYFRPGKPGTTGMQIVGSGPDDEVEAVKRAMVRMIYSAKESVLIQSPYLMPDTVILEAMQDAAAAGVEVIVMLPGIPDKKTVYRVTISYIQSLLDFGIKVYLYNGFLHAKMLVVDDRICTIGTTNLDMRSFSFHFEVNAVIYDSAVARECAGYFRKDMEHSREMTVEEYKARGTWTKFVEAILRLFAPLM